MSETPQPNDHQELIQCPNCLGYFTRQLEDDGELPEYAIEKHICFIGGRQLRPEEQPD